MTERDIHPFPTGVWVAILQNMTIAEVARFGLLGKGPAHRKPRRRIWRDLLVRDNRGELRIVQIAERLPMSSHGTTTCIRPRYLSPKYLVWARYMAPAPLGPRDHSHAGETSIHREVATATSSSVERACLKGFPVD